MENLLALMRRLKDGSFRPLPLRHVHIPKGDGKTRPLGIPAVRDRVAQEVLRQLLSPLFERIFHDDSYGFRPARGCHRAVARRRRFCGLVPERDSGQGGTRPGRAAPDAVDTP
ncbi:MAG: reverse transcriptase domain-containing protein [Candidatus Dormibacteraceae bacterium]